MRQHWHTYLLLVRVIVLEHIIYSYICTCMYNIMCMHHIGDKHTCTHNYVVLIIEFMVSSSPFHHTEVCKSLENPSLLITSIVIGLKI